MKFKKDGKRGLLGGGVERADTIDTADSFIEWSGIRFYIIIGSDVLWLS